MNTAFYKTGDRILMTNNIYQPLIFNNNISISSKLLTHPSNINRLQNKMYIYELSKTETQNCIVSGNSILIPCTNTTWLIGYNHSDNSAAFYCIGPSAHKREYSFGDYEHYFCVHFDDICSYLAKGVPEDTYPSSMANEIYEYVPSKGSYEYSLIKDFKNSTSFDAHISMFNGFLEKGKQCCYIPANMITLTDMIKKAYGSIHISELATSLGYSERHILRMFNETMGMSAKDYCKTVRFQTVISNMLSNKALHNSAYIAGLGYSDQAHFQREFKLFTGMTPRQFIKQTASF